MSATATPAPSVTDASVPTEAAAPASTWALLVDLEFAALDGLPLLNACAAQVLAGHGIELTNALFARFMLGHPTANGLAALLAHFKQPRDKAAQAEADIAAAFDAAIVSAPPRPLTKALIKQVSDHGGMLSFVTAIESDAATRAIAQIGLPEITPVLEAKPEGWGHHGTDTWVRLARGTHLAERHCMAIVATAESARSALMANVNVSALVGPLTDHQDFGGVDFVGSGASAKEATTIFDLLKTRL